MPGILESFQDPATQGLLSLSANLLRAGGPSTTPVSFGGALGNAFTGYQADQQRNALLGLEQAKMKMTEQQLKQAQQQDELRQKLLQQFGVFPGGAAPVQGASAPSVPTPAGMSQSTSNLAFGSPEFATPTAPAAPTPGGLNVPPAGFPFNLNQVAALKLAGMPDLTSAYQAAQPDLSIQNGFIVDKHRGITGSVPNTNQQGFSTITVPDPSAPGGFKVVQVPGGNEAFTAQQGIMEREKARYGFEPVTMANGAVVPVSRLSLASGGAGGAGGMARPTSAAPAAPEKSGDPWSNIPLLPQPKGVGQSTYDKNIAETRAKFAGTLSEKYGGLAEQADQRIALNNQALSLIDKADTGPLAAQQAEVKSWLMKFANIPEEDFKNDPSATKALDKDLLNAATQKAKAQFGARITQQEVMLMLSRGAPNVDMPKAAMKYLIESDNAGSQYQKQQASDLGRYLSSGGDPHQFEAWYAKSFPMTGAVSKVHLDTGKRPPLSAFQK